MKPIQAIKLVHTIIWMFFVSLILHVFYAGWTDSIQPYTWFAIALVFLEGIVLVMNRGKCPLTQIAARYEAEASHNFDIFLPEWLAKHNQRIFTWIFAIGVSLVLFRTILQKV